MLALDRKEQISLSAIVLRGVLLRRPPSPGSQQALLRYISSSGSASNSALTPHQHQHQHKRSSSLFRALIGDVHLMPCLFHPHGLRMGCEVA